MFANCQMGGMNMAAPDVCMTPMGPSTPPIPYPNIAQGAMANPGTAATKVLVSGAPAHTLQTMVPMSSGDNPGVCGGVMSGSVMGPRRHLMGATNVLMGGMPATKLTDQTGQNGMSLNATGATIAPAQTKVMIMSGGSSGGAGGSPSQSSSGGPGAGSGPTSQEASSSSQDPQEEEELTVENPQWEHVDENARDQNPDIALAGDTIKLQVDVSNAPNGTKVSFKIFDTSVSPAIRLDVVYGEVADGSGSAEWLVRTCLQDGRGEPTLEFEGQVRNVRSERAEIQVGAAFFFSV